jgi:hypothetical protein
MAGLRRRTPVWTAVAMSSDKEAPDNSPIDR